ncbi:hypothetical protein BDW02DRAFT_650896 [Decorospora gaudefroyi]|uniref:Uncharacterized protein n=1 Tax=Decorospora gaudefroyi TaxID=184978 RepID=A0A6A5K9L9_9PLEO|nr:hypothetical protein BDW02DRAFT_650896 [Decorospora gaudefroyi]
MAILSLVTPAGEGTARWGIGAGRVAVHDRAADRGLKSWDRGRMTRSTIIAATPHVQHFAIVIIATFWFSSESHVLAPPTGERAVLLNFRARVQTLKFLDRTYGTFSRSLVLQHKQEVPPLQGFATDPRGLSTKGNIGHVDGYQRVYRQGPANIPCEGCPLTQQERLEISSPFVFAQQNFRSVPAEATESNVLPTHAPPDTLPSQSSHTDQHRYGDVRDSFPGYDPNRFPDERLHRPSQRQSGPSQSSQTDQPRYGDARDSFPSYDPNRFLAGDDHSGRHSQRQPGHELPLQPSPPKGRAEGTAQQRVLGRKSRTPPTPPTQPEPRAPRRGNTQPLPLDTSGGEGSYLNYPTPAAPHHHQPPARPDRQPTSSGTRAHGHGFGDLLHPTNDPPSTTQTTSTTHHHAPAGQPTSTGPAGSGRNPSHVPPPPPAAHHTTTTTTTTTTTHHHASAGHSTSTGPAAHVPPPPPPQRRRIITLQQASPHSQANPVLEEAST